MPTLRTGLIAGILLVVGMVLIVLGLPSQTPTQRLLGSLSQVPIAAAIVVMVLHMARTWGLWRSAVFTTVFWLGLAGVVVGVGWILLNPSGGGDIVLWSGVGCWFVWFVVDYLRRG